ncbi:MAG: FtsX-like permease family protein [Actinobacteria bacterium]|nr:FtsX-like permease family protein [Actinomycetota bacterium]
MDKRIRVTIIIAIATAVALFYLVNNASNTNSIRWPNVYGSDPGNVITTLKTPVDLEKAKVLVGSIKAEYTIYRLNTYSYYYDDERPLAVLGLDTSHKDVKYLYKLRTGRLPVAEGEVAVSAKVAERLNKKTGESFVVPSKIGHGFEKQIVGLIEDGNLNEFDKRIAVLPLAVAQKDYGYPSKINQINLRVPIEDVGRVVGTLNKNFALYGGFARSLNSQVKNEVYSPPSNSIEMVLYGSLVLFAAFVLIDSIFTSNIQRTRRIYATYRILGATRNYLRKLIMLESLKVGVTGSLIGVALGNLMLIGLDTISRVFLTKTPFAGFNFSLSLAVLSVTLGILATLFASFRGFRVLARIKPIEIYRMSNIDQEKSIGWLRVVSCFALLLLGLAGLSYYALDPATKSKALFGGLGFILSLLGLMQLTTILLSFALKLALRLLGTNDFLLVADNIKRRLRKTGSVAAILAMTSFIMFFSIGIVNSQIEGTLALQKQSFPGDIMLTFRNAIADVSPGLINEIRELDNIEAATSWQVIQVSNSRGENGAIPKPIRHSLVTATLLGIEPETFNAVSPLILNEGVSKQICKELSGNQILVSKPVARAGKLKIGDQLVLPTDDENKLSLEVAGIVSNTLGQVDIFVNKQFLRKELGYPYDNKFAIKTNGSYPKALEQLLESYPQLQKQTFADIWPKIRNGILSAYFIPILSLNIGLILISIFGLFNLLNTTIMERKREIGVLRAIGLTGKKLRILLHVEGFLVGLIGLIAGSLGGFIISITLFRAFAYMVYQEEGYLIPTGVPIWLWGLVAGIVIIVSQVATYLPARKVVGENIIRAIAHE